MRKKIVAIIEKTEESEDRKMEKMSDKELQLMRELQAKKKRIERQEKEFWEMVSNRREEVMAYLTRQTPEQREPVAQEHERRWE